MEEQLVEAWEIHNRIVLYVLDAVAREALEGSPAQKGRSAGEMFAHIHNVRLMWLKAAAPDLLEGLEKVEKEVASNKETLRRSLEASGQAISELFKRGIAAGGKIKGFKPHAAAFLGYLISHEAYHQGEIGVVLGQSGRPLDKKTAYGMWEWGVR
ncbi:MAG TPA: DinB family protein [Chloroflexia bacterium]|nr:DinB family protein [Chloroflexia bacterium]